MMSDELEAFNVIVQGKVQGVFFRASMKKIAEQNNVAGWVRNLNDGGVESLVQGKESDVAKVLEWCRVGPTNSRVDRVTVTKINLQPALRNFTIVF